MISVGHSLTLAKDAWEIYQSVAAIVHVTDICNLGITCTVSVRKQLFLKNPFLTVCLGMKLRYLPVSVRTVLSYSVPST